MTNKRQTMAIHGDRELVMTRRFAAPRHLVWQAYTDCAHLSQWWGPTGWTVPHCELDLRPGGKWHYCMKGEMPDGSVMESWGLAVYREIVPPERLVYVDAFSDSDGTISADLPQMLITVTFEEIDGQTLLTSITEFDSAEALQTVIDMGMEQGITQTWDRLDAHLPTMRDDLVRLEGDETIVITRVFNAPPQVVFDAMTQPQHVRIWYGPRSRSTQVTICEIDLRVGGHWRFVIQTQSGDEVDFYGEYLTIDRPRHLVFTEIFAPFPETVSTIDTVYHDLSGRTRLVATCTYPSQAARDGIIASGMEGGLRETYDQLDVLVTRLTAAATTPNS
ncbi:MAG: SRPBCC domain-containing protein [Anaerolineae bacterium]|nr:SRPBCC domain-containing protein [Anaerolineae bacterium]